MDGRGFDDLTRRFATKRSRRVVLKGLLGLGGATVATTVARGGSEAAWSTLVCLPDGGGGYIQRLVPTSAVPFYRHRYGAVLPENGSCPACQPGYEPGPEGCQATCETLCGGDWCVYLASGDVGCATVVNQSCGDSCTSAADCVGVPDRPHCILEVTEADGSPRPGCGPEDYCGAFA